MKLIVGLGNPGKEYARTRHNAGFMVVEAFADELGTNWTSDKDRHALIAKASIDGINFLLAKPTTFMNLSGDSVHALLSYYKIPLTDLLVIQDELDLAPGSLTFTPKAGTAGHNGIASIFERTGQTDVTRLRIGVGRSTDKIPTEDWVLQNMDQATLEVIPKAVEATCDWIHDGLLIAMNRWNRKS